VFAFPTTCGEKLGVIIYDSLISRSDWGTLRNSYPLRQRKDEYLELFQEILTVNLTCRIVALGRSLNAGHRNGGPVALAAFQKRLRDNIGIPNDLLPLVLRNATLAVDAAEHDFTAAETKEQRRHARARAASCFMCGVALDCSAPVQGQATPHDAFELEHIWPQSYGGDSELDNALPACHSCNNAKANFATWGMVAIQSLIFGMAPTPRRLDEIDKTYKFALHSRNARHYARRHSVTMKVAFQSIGPWSSVEVKDEDDVADFFNLTTMG
jgi:hypothetical protein